MSIRPPQPPTPELPHDWTDCECCGFAFDANETSNGEVCEDCRGFGAI